jgi:hypothetical protein
VAPRAARHLEPAGHRPGTGGAARKRRRTIPQPAAPGGAADGAGGPGTGTGRRARARRRAGAHDAVQAATPATIALLALEPDARKSSVRITAEAKNSDDMIAYVEALQRVEWFTTVLLARHEINEQDANRPIRFQIDAQWRAAR